MTLDRLPLCDFRTRLAKRKEAQTDLQRFRRFRARMNGDIIVYFVHGHLEGC